MLFERVIKRNWVFGGLVFSVGNSVILEILVLRLSGVLMTV